MNHDKETRRKLLKMAVYVPPAILGVALSGTAEGAEKCNGYGEIIVSANGNACCPCVENSASKQCAKARCKLGNKSACGGKHNEPQ